MNQPRLGDIARQFANVFTAIFQTYASSVAGSLVGAIAQESRSFILPASYAFAIWGPIFILCGIYAIYQAMPVERESPVFRAVGWWTAGAFLANGLWTYAYTNRLFIVAQAIIFVAAVLATGAFLRFARETPTAGATTIENALIGPALGLLAGWLTVASGVGLAGTLVAQGFAPAGVGAEVRDAVLLIAAAVGAFGVILASKRGPSGVRIAYSAAVLWALAAVIVEQRSASTVTTIAAAVCAMLVLAALAGPLAAPSGPAGGPGGA